jgi:hypothetical protein
MDKTSHRDHEEYFFVVEGRGLHISAETVARRRRGD